MPVATQPLYNISLPSQAVHLIVLAGQSNAGWPLSAFVKDQAPTAGQYKNPYHHFSLISNNADGSIDQLVWTHEPHADISALSFYLAQANQPHNKTAAKDHAATLVPLMLLEPQVLLEPLVLLDVSYAGSALSAWLPPTTLSKTDEPLPALKPWHLGALWPSRLVPALALQPAALIWYQGEQDAMAKNLDAPQWQQQLRQWLMAVRRHYAGPVLAVQLAGFGAATLNANSGFAAIRQQQFEVFGNDAKLGTPAQNCQLISAADLGHASDIHLGDKKQLARRLSYALNTQVPAACAHLEWHSLTLYFPLGNWQQGLLSTDGQLQPDTGPTMLLGWLSDGQVLTLTARTIFAASESQKQNQQRDQLQNQSAQHATTTELGAAIGLQLQMPTLPAQTQLVAIAYGWADCPRLNWYQQVQDQQQQPLYWPLLPMRWQREQINTIG